jgi:hypothetical protein
MPERVMAVVLAGGLARRRSRFTALSGAERIIFDANPVDAAEIPARDQPRELAIGCTRILIPGRRSIQGWPSGTSIDSEDTLAFSALGNVRPMIETMPLERAPEAYERMMSGEARFRMVLTTGL